MIDLYSPRGEMELLILRSILEDAGIPFFVRNDTFGSLYGSRYSEAYNRKTICVPEAVGPEARVLVREFLVRTGQGGSIGEDIPEPPAADRRPAHPRVAAALTLLRRFGDRLARRFGPIPGLRRAAPPADPRSRFRLIQGDGPMTTGSPTGDGGSQSHDGEPGRDDHPRDQDRPPLRLV